MKSIENECVNCASDFGYCADCGRKTVEITYCDECKSNISNEYYEIDGLEFCKDCLNKYIKEKYLVELYENNQEIFFEMLEVESVSI